MLPACLPAGAWLGAGGAGCTACQPVRAPACMLPSAAPRPAAAPHVAQGTSPMMFACRAHEVGIVSKLIQASRPIFMLLGCGQHSVLGAGGAAASLVIPLCPAGALRRCCLHAWAYACTNSSSAAAFHPLPQRGAPLEAANGRGVCSDVSALQAGLQGGALDAQHAAVPATPPADTGCPPAAGETALHYAACHDCPGAVGVLLQAGASVGAPTVTSLTPLHLTGSNEAAQLLLAAGANLNVQDGRGRTPVVFRLWEAGDPEAPAEARAASAAVAALLVSAARGVGVRAAGRELAAARVHRPSSSLAELCPSSPHRPCAGGAGRRHPHSRQPGAQLIWR